MEVLAYIDPGAGSLFVQALNATAIAVPFFMRSQIKKAVGAMRRSLRRRREADQS